MAQSKTNILALIIFVAVVLLIATILHVQQPRETFYNTPTLQVELYDLCNYGGKSQKLGVGSYKMDVLSASGAIGNDTVSSMRIPPGLKVTVYEHDNSGGRSISFTENVSCLMDHMMDVQNKISWNKQMSSIKIEPAVQLFEHCNYGGKRQVLGVGSYTLAVLNANDAIGNDKISSMRIPRGLKVTVYEHDNFGGKSMTFTADVPCLTNNMMDAPNKITWNDQISSIKIEPR